MTQKRDKDISSKIQEIDLDVLGAALENLQKQDEELLLREAEEAALALEAGYSDDTDSIEVLEEIGVLKKEKGLKKMPIERDQDKRRMGK